jgi:uncharacterized protein YkwD
LALAASRAAGAPSAARIEPWVAYEGRLRARLADAGGGQFDALAGQTLLALTNRARAAAGVGPLVWHEGLGRTAHAHAADLAARAYVEHLSPEGFDPSHRFWLLDRRTVGSPSENIAYHRGGDPASAERFLAQWRKSPPHWANLLRPSHTHAGFGLVHRGDRGYAVGLYAAPLARLAAPLPFRIRDFAEARQVVRGWDDLSPDLRPRVGSPQGAGSAAPQGAPPWLMQLSVRRRLDEQSVEAIGGPIFLMGGQGRPG